MKKKKIFRRRVLFIILIGIIFYSYGRDTSLNNLFGYNIKDILAGAEGLNGDNIYSESGILMDLQDSSILYEKKIDKKIYPASLTKIMTAIVALENINSLDDRVVISQEDFIGVLEEGAAVAGFKAGESVSNRDLLYGIILRSGAETSNAMANSLGGRDRFVELMNAKARELGMDRTSFTNPSGLHDDRHYTSVRDLSKLLDYALGNGDFRAILSRDEYTATNGLLMRSRVKERLDYNKMDGFKIVAGKSGYTDKAGLCLASLCVKDGKEYILITTGSKGGPNTIQYNYEDAYKIYKDYL